MNIPQEAIDLIKRFEGCRLKAYSDPVGIPTIGYGHTSGVHLGQTITAEQAEAFLREDLKDSMDAVARLVQVQLTPNQAGALVSFVFNCGTGAFFASTLLKLVNRRDWTGAAAEFGKWVHGGSVKVLPGLVDRRQAERILFLKGLPAKASRVVVVPQIQHTPVSCGQCSVAMCLTAMGAGAWDDTRVNRLHGFGLIDALRTEDPCHDWRDLGNLDKQKWTAKVAPTLRAGYPVIVGLNGPEFSPSGRGHIVTLVSVDQEVVKFADPATGGWKLTTVGRLLDAPPHPDGKFVLAPNPKP